MKDYYSILMVHPRAETFVIDSAYKRLAREYHPDLCKLPNMHERMIEINEAYEVLSDPVRRQAFDQEYFGTNESRAAEPVPNVSNAGADSSLETIIIKASALMRGDNYPPAISLLKRAMDLNPYDRRVEKMLKEAKRTWGQMLIRNQR